MTLEPILEPFTFYLSFKDIFDKSTLLISNKSQEDDE